METKKYIVSLNRLGRRENRQEEMETVLRNTARVTIVEGSGFNAITVMMPEVLVEPLQAVMPYAVIDKHKTLELL